MKEAYRRELDDLMKARNQRSEESRKQLDAARSQKEIFLGKFDKLAQDVIRPIMEDMGQCLREHDNNFRIEETSKQMIDQIGLEKAHPNIEMTIIPKGTPPDQYKPPNIPHISFNANEYTEKIQIIGGNIKPGGGGKAGPRGEFDIAEITSGVVEEEIMKLLREIFPG